jgi:hypothetical protein
MPLEQRRAQRFQLRCGALQQGVVAVQLLPQAAEVALVVARHAVLLLPQALQHLLHVGDARRLCCAALLQLLLAALLAHCRQQ